MWQEDIEKPAKSDNKFSHAFAFNTGDEHVSAHLNLVLPLKNNC